jgi:hypothetical protein
MAILLASALLAGGLGAEEVPMRDPMRPYEYAQAQGAGVIAPRRLALTAVLVAPNRRVAVINGAIHREGDWIEGAQITRIEPQLVHLRRGGDDIVVRLEARRAEPQIDEGESAS